MIKAKKAFVLVLGMVVLARVQADIIFASTSSTFELNGPSAQLVLDTPVTNYTGTLKITDKSATSVTQDSTETITFASGKLQVAGNEATFTGVYDPAGSDTLTLNGSRSLHVEAGEVAEAISVSGTGNEITGSPKLSGGITLADASTELTLGMTSKLDSNIVLNGGKIILKEDLHMGDGVQITGNGTIDVQGRSIILPFETTDPIPGDIEFLNANDVTVRVRTIKNNTWNFAGAGEFSTLRGWGVIVDLSGGGRIRCRTNHTLDINDLHLRGIGSGAGDILLESGALVRLTNVTIELQGSYTQTNGTIRVDGDGCKVIAGDGEQFIVSGATSVLDVDSVVLRYDNLGSSVVDPFTTASGGTITKSNGGQIRSTFIPGGGGETTIGGSGGTETNLDLTSNSTLTFDDSGNTITFDGNGNAIIFRETDGTPFVVTANTTVVLEDTLVKNFDPSQVSLGAGAALEFGDGTRVTINKDLTIDPTIPLTFIGDATLDGKGSKIVLNGSETLTATGNKTVNVKDTKLVLNNYDSMKAFDDNATFDLQNMDVYMTNTGASFNSGNITITDTVTIAGADQTAFPGAGSQFEFISVGSLDIAGGSTLKIDSGATFKYEPNITGDGADPAVEKRHMTFANPSSTLILNDCTFDTGAHGLIFDHGKIIVDGRSDIVISNVALKEFELGSAALLDIMPAAVFNVDGPIKMIATTFP